MSGAFPDTIKTRIAPTPSGYIHIGNAFSFLLTWAIARRNKGTILLRIDDLDADRKRPEYVRDIFESLHWLGIDWDEGPKNAEEFESRFSQSFRISRYSELLDRFKSDGLVFGCSCSRTDLADKKIYPGTCIDKQLPLDSEGISWRIKSVPDSRICFTDILKGDLIIPVEEMGGNFVIRRKDKLPAYQVASVTDDIDFGINLIIRGEDLLTSTASQLYLTDLAGAYFFERRISFLHHPLILDTSGEKLSKSKGAESIKYLRENSVEPSQVWNWFATQFGYSGATIEKAEQLIEFAEDLALRHLPTQLFPFLPK